MCDPDQKRGLYRKWSVERLDDVEGKHDNCVLFVLDINHDPYAIAALAEYISTCKDKFPKLAKDLNQLLLSMPIM